VRSGHLSDLSAVWHWRRVPVAAARATFRARACASVPSRSRPINVEQELRAAIKDAQRLMPTQSMERSRPPPLRGSAWENALLMLLQLAFSFAAVGVSRRYSMNAVNITPPKTPRIIWDVWVK